MTNRRIYVTVKGQTKAFNSKYLAMQWVYKQTKSDALRAKARRQAGIQERLYKREAAERGRLAANILYPKTKSKKYNVARTQQYKTMRDIQKGKLVVPENSVMAGGVLFTGGKTQFEAIQAEKSKQRMAKRSEAQYALAKQLDILKGPSGTITASWTFDKKKQMQPEFKITNEVPIFTGIDRPVSMNVPKVLKTTNYSTGFEKAVAAQQTRQKAFEESKGIQRIKGMANIITQPKAWFTKEYKTYNQRSWGGKVTEALAGGVMGSPYFIGAGVGMAGEKSYLAGRGLVANPKGTLKEVLVTAPKTTISTTFDPRKPEGAASWIAIFGGAAFEAMGSYVKAPLRVPKDIKLNIAKSMTTTERSYLPVQSKAGRTGGISKTDILRHDTHTFTDINLATGKTPVVVGIGKQGGYTVVQSVIGKTVRTQISKRSVLGGTKVSVIEQVPTTKIGQMSYTTKTTSFTKVGLNKNMDFPDIQGKTYISKGMMDVPRISIIGREQKLIDSQYKYIKVGHAMVETRMDTYSFKQTSMAKIGKYKAIRVFDISMLEHTQVAHTKAGQNIYTTGVRFSIKDVGKYDVPLYTKGKHPNLVFGELTKPKDIVNIKASASLPSMDITLVDMSKGSRVVKDIHHIYRDKSFRVIETENLLKQSMGKIWKHKGAQLKVGSKTDLFKDIKIGGKLKPTMPEVGTDIFFSWHEMLGKRAGIKPKGLSVQMDTFRLEKAMPNIKSKTRTKQQLQPTTKIMETVKLDTQLSNKLELMPREVQITQPTTKLTQMQRQDLKLQQVLRMEQITTGIGTLSFTHTTLPPITVPPPRPPTTIPFSFDFGSILGKTTKRKTGSKAKQPKAYQPTAFSAMLDIRGTKTSFGELSGLGIRPIIKRKKKKK